MTAIAIRTGEQTLQVQMCVDELVPADDVLRRVELLVDWAQGASYC